MKKYISKKEEILSSCISKMINRTNQSYESIEEMKKQPEWNAVLEAMEKYATYKISKQKKILK